MGNDLETNMDSKTTNCKIEEFMGTLLQVEREGMVGGL